MSAGQFVRSKYQMDDDAIVSVRVQPETLLATIAGGSNAAPGATVTQSGSARVNGSRRMIGINCRQIRLAWTGAVPDGYKPDGIVVIPWLLRASFVVIKVGDTGSYLGQSVQVIGKTSEAVR
jgi:hypothetical protein